MGSLVFVKNNIPFTTSLEIAEGVNNSHTSVLKLIKSSLDLDTFFDLKSNKVKTKGAPVEVFSLTEEQATLLIALMKNTPIVRDFKNRLVREFFKQRKLLQKLLNQQSNAEWLSKRQETKAVRKECTDTIKKFVDYAISQGSQSASKYYVALSKMELSGLFLMEQKYPNARDVMSMRQLNLIEMADEAVATALEEAMNSGLHYKECYVKAKEKIQLLAKIFPPSPLPLLLGNA